MLNKIKKIFKKVTKTVCPRILPLKFNRGWFGAVFFFVFLGLALPSQFAQAGFLDVLASIPIALITLVLQAVLAISNLILSLAGVILGWVTGPNFITLPYTRGGIVDVGWPIVRDFINMFFIIALVVIGLATALRIKEYQFQKTLPTLILIAILINFTPVICGLIIDAANILMNFFLEKFGGGYIFSTFFNMQGSIIAEVFTPGHWFDLRYAASGLGKTVVMIIFDWVAAYVFTIYSLLFIMRYVMLWALVIVSPMAFFSRIFPGSQKYLFKSILGWDEWWKEFIEWSLIGVVAGFFLFLGEQLMVKAPGMISGLPPTGSTWGLSNPFVEFFNNFLPWMVVLVFLWLGYKITKEISAMGAQGAIKAVDTGIKLAAGSALAAVTLGAGAAGLAGLMGKAAAGAGRLESFTGSKLRLPFLGGRKFEPLKWMTKPITAPIRAVEKFAGPRLEKFVGAEEESASKEGGEAKKRDVKGNLRALRRFDATAAQKREVLSTMIDLNQIKDASNPNVVGKISVLSDKEVLESYENAKKKGKVETAEKFEQTFGGNNNIRTEMAKITDRVTAKLAPDDRTGPNAGRPSGLNKNDVDEKHYASFTDKIADSVKTLEDMKRLQKGWWNNSALMESAQKFWGGPQLGKAADVFGRSFVDKYMETVEGRQKPVKWFLENNQSALTYFTGNAAQDFGYRPIKGLARDEISELIRWWRTGKPQRKPFQRKQNP